MRNYKTTAQAKRFGNYYDDESIPFQARVFERVQRDFHISIGDVITTQLDIEQAIAVLHAAEEGDTVTIHLNCGGGNAVAGDSLIYAMQKCKVPIHVIGTGHLMSFATFILLEADSFELSPFCDLLFHSAAFGVQGKMADTLQQAEFTFKQCEKMLRYYYKHFFTDEELDRIIHGKYEHYMDVEEFVERFERRNKALAQESGNVSNVEQLKDAIFDIIDEGVLGYSGEPVQTVLQIYDAIIDVLKLPKDVVDDEPVEVA